MINTIFIIAGILVLIIFLLSLSIIHLRSIRDDIADKWYNLAEKLQYRQDLAPNLIETIRLFLPPENTDQYKDLIEKSIEARSAAAKNIKPGSEKIIAEHDFSAQIKELFKLGEKYDEISKSTNYLELKKDFKDIRIKIEELIKNYNNKVRDYNSILSRPYNMPGALIMRYKKKLIFDFYLA